MFESLEARQHLSATPGASISKGRTLYVRGTDAADTIAISRWIDSDSLGLWVNNVNLANYQPGDFRRVHVDAGGDDDTVNLTYASRPAEVFGGAGDDTVTAPGGSDALFGNGGGAASTLWGGDGNDSLLGGNHNDNLFGEAGNDTLFGDRGYDSLHGGPGADTWRPSRGRDNDFHGDLETRDDGGATVVHDDLESNQLTYKVTRQNGRTILRLTAFFWDEGGYDVAFGALSPVHVPGTPRDITIDYTRLVERPPITSYSLQPVMGISRRAYYDLGPASPADHTIHIRHPDHSIVTTLTFRA
jgi:Ca2+-binding RTX toxin-like protein